MPEKTWWGVGEHLGSKNPVGVVDEWSGLKKTAGAVDERLGLKKHGGGSGRAFGLEKTQSGQETSVQVREDMVRVGDKRSGSDRHCR